MRRARTTEAGENICDSRDSELNYSNLLDFKGIPAWLRIFTLAESANSSTVDEHVTLFVTPFIFVKYCGEGLSFNWLSAVVGSAPARRYLRTGTLHNYLRG